MSITSKHLFCFHNSLTKTKEIIKNKNKCVNSRQTVRHTHIYKLAGRASSQPHTHTHTPTHSHRAATTTLPFLVYGLIITTAGWPEVDARRSAVPTPHLTRLLHRPIPLCGGCSWTRNQSKKQKNKTTTTPCSLTNTRQECATKL